MIQANELRIGNLIMRDKNSHKPDFDEIDKEWKPTIVNGKLISEFENNPNLCSHYHYVSLTEEWLLKFGFENVDNEIDFSEWVINGKAFKLYGNGSDKQEPFKFCYDIDHEEIVVELPFVHQRPLLCIKKS